MQKNQICLPIFLGGPMGPIHPVWGHLVISVWAGRTLVSELLAMHVHLYVALAETRVTRYTML